MKIELCYGCTYDSFEIDGERAFDLPAGRLHKIVLKILHDLNVDKDAMLGFIEQVTRDNGDCRSGEYCSQCGDTPHTYTLEL